jgi:glucose/arabinose dehydrogenase
MKRTVPVVLLLVVVSILVGWFALRPPSASLPVEAVMGAAPQITAPQTSVLPMANVAKAVGWKAGEKPIPAPGLKVSEFAGGLDHPRWMTRLPNGDVLVAETNSPPRPQAGIQNRVMRYLMGRAGAGEPSPNKITLLRDADHDGVAEMRTELIGGLNSPFGMAVLGEWLYIANNDAVVRVPFQVGQTKIDATPELVVALPKGGGHWARNLIVSADGSLLYVTVGSTSNIADNGIAAEKERAAIWEVNPATKEHHIFASGLRNPNGLAFEPTSGVLWTTVNERDFLGPDMAPDYMTSVQPGGFYGWPWFYWDGIVDQRVPERPADLQGKVLKPDYALGPHTASLGLTFATGQALGAAFGEGAFVGQHGSWNRTPSSGYKVLFVPFANGKPTGAKPVDVLAGFLSDNEEARGRPVGVIFDQAGALLVADDVGNRIWRVSGT